MILSHFKTMTQRNCPMAAVTCSTASIIRTNSLGQCLKCGTISLGQSLIYLDKLVRSVVLCLKFKRPCENVHFFENTKGSRQGVFRNTLNLSCTEIIIYFIIILVLTPLYLKSLIEVLEVFLDFTTQIS